MAETNFIFTSTPHHFIFHSLFKQYWANECMQTTPSSTNTNWKKAATLRFAIFGSGIEKEIIISPSLHPRLAKNWMHVLRTYILSCFKAHLSSWHYSARIRLKLTVIAWTFHNKLKASHIKSQIIVWLAFHFIEVLHNRQRKEPRHLVIQSATSRWS